MKKQITILAIIVSFFFLTACPYKSTVPIDKPETINEKILGKWQKKGEDNDYYLITKENDKQLLIDESNYTSDSAGYTHKFYKAFLTKVGDGLFMNLSREDEVDTYYLYRIEIKDNVLMVKELSENIKETFYSSDELKKFIKKYMELSFFYGTEDVYLKR